MLATNILPLLYVPCPEGCRDGLITVGKPRAAMRGPDDGDSFEIACPTCKGTGHASCECCGNRAATQRLALPTADGRSAWTTDVCDACVSEYRTSH